VVAASHAPVQWDIVDNIKDAITPEAIASIKKTRVGVSGEFVTQIGRDTLPSINTQLRLALNLYANVVSAFNIPGAGTRASLRWLVVCRMELCTPLLRVGRRHAVSAPRRGHRHDSVRYCCSGCVRVGE
jgi:hypothetical protein